MGLPESFVAILRWKRNASISWVPPSSRSSAPSTSGGRHESVSQALAILGIPSRFGNHRQSSGFLQITWRKPCPEGVSFQVPR